MKFLVDFSMLLFWFSLNVVGLESACATEASSNGQNVTNSFSILAKPLGANLQSGLVGCCAALTPGAAFELNIGSNSSVLIEAERQVYNTTYGDAGKRFLMGNAFGVSYKYFVRPTIYLKGGVSHRSVSYSYRTDYESSEFEGRSTAATIAFGNQWAISQHLVFGIDWIGYAVPFTSSLSSESLSGTNQADAQSRMDKVKESTMKERAFFGLNIYSGASF